MTTGSVIAGSPPLPTAIVLGPVPMLNVIKSRPGFALAARIASRRLHVPSQLLPMTVSAVVFTVYVMTARATCDGRRANSIDAVSTAVESARMPPRPTLSPSPRKFPGRQPTADSAGDPKRDYRGSTAVLPGRALQLSAKHGHGATALIRRQATADTG